MVEAPAELEAGVLEARAQGRSTRDHRSQNLRSVPMRFLLTIDLPDPVIGRPGIPIAQMLREIEPVVEHANPLQSGKLLDRLTGETRAMWEVQGLVPIGAPIINTWAPDPGPVGDENETVGFSLTGN